ncbi:MAG: hypothetical protein ACOX7M_06520 [Dysosmobacter sp.]|jgi:hypothetical protein|uniref:hypothetical protein n=1 Tax=Dysosmobacter sp. TaxID=2591382 RepID=UPI003D8F2E7C
MRISFEAECFPLFVTGVLVLLAGEVLFALLALRRRPEARGPLLAHVLCVAVAFFCLGRMLFVSQPTPDGDVYNSSILLAAFGIFWFLGECCGLWALIKDKEK